MNNHQNDTWYYYNNLPVRAVSAIDGVLYFGTPDGRLMEFSRAYRNDNLEDIDAYWESGSMDFDLDWRRKYSSTVWTAMKPESQALIMLTTESNIKSDYPDKVVTAGLSTLRNVNFKHWSFGTNLTPGTMGWNDLEVDGQLQGRLLGDRLLINGNFGYRDRPTYTSNFVGDFDIRYILTPHGGVSLRAYSETSDRYFTPSSLTTQGVGITLQRDFTRFSQLFRRTRKEKKKP